MGFAVQPAMSCYAANLCINVSWVDGPTKEAVEEIVGCFQEGSFDGMRDLYE
ncbi:hypothetical protein ABNR98_004453 [Salmonella enterica]